MSVEWSDAALDDVEAITDYIAHHDRTAAARVERRIRESTARLADQPSIGRPGRVGQTRELILSPYIVAYRVRGNVVEALAVIDRRRGSFADIVGGRLP